jgi:enoyl-CoA hydratase/3-hydroxyacyl-CoA dehydrogenase
MPFTLGSRKITKVAVIGSGQIGPDIALHFAKVLGPFGVKTVVVDVSEKALQAGQARMTKKVDKGAETGAWKPAEAQAMKAAVTFTTDYAQAAGADLVVEAATEDEALKGKIFQQLETTCRPDAIFLSNSSHLEPERIFAPLKDKSRTAVAHYFFPAERNVMVEVVPGEATAPEVTAWLLRFYEQIGKIPVEVQSRYGYAADPIFEGIFAAACLAVQEGLGTVKEVDFAARAALGMTVGPFTAMNLTGGNPITAHGLDLMHERFASVDNQKPWYAAPQLLKDKLASEGPTGQWQVCGRGETVTLPPEKERRIVEALRGAYLGLCFGIVDTGIVGLSDFELLIETALDLKGPCRMLNELGASEALHLVEKYAKTHEGLPVTELLKLQAEADAPIPLSNLLQETLETPDGTIHLVRIRRPKVLNALNEATYGELLSAIEALAWDGEAIGMVISGFGTKAFVSGADIHALAAVRSPDDGYAIAKLAHDVARGIEMGDKPIVAALNGLAFGGGLELAMACHARVAAEKLKVLAALPEVNLGIIPAGGGTQRLPRLVGLEKANVLLRTGGSLSSDEALACGLVQELAPQADVVERAAALVHALATGKKPWKRIAEEPIAQEPVTLAPVDIGHRSKRVDELLVESITYGAAHTMDEGLSNELGVFREICELKDMRIGVEHFVKNGPKTPAEFVHG